MHQSSEDLDAIIEQTEEQLAAAVGDRRPFIFLVVTAELSLKCLTNLHKDDLSDLKMILERALKSIEEASIKNPSQLLN